MRLIQFLKNEEKRTVCFLLVSLAALLASFFKVDVLPVDAAWIAIVLCGIPILIDAAVGLATRFDIKADVLVSVALIASVAIGEVFAAGEIAFIMALGAFLEEKTVSKARAGIERLVRLTPTTARVVHGEAEAIVPAEQVRAGDTLRVLAGETIAVDGVISHGETSIDQSVMTGESIPVDKRAGDAVFSGTVNQYGTFEMLAQKVGKDSALQRMIRLVESADAGKAKIVRTADRWATWIVIIALLSAVGTGLVTGEILRAVTVLVVFCPCALVLATPTAIMAGIGNATQHGILIREGDALERLAQVRRVAFDKTGTLTHGKPAVVRIACADPAYDEAALLETAASAELRSEHPLGKAVVSYHRQRTGHPPKAPESFALLAGRGVSAVVNGRRVLLGSDALLKAQGVPLPASLAAQAEQVRKDGSTVLYLAIQGQIAGWFALADTLRADAAHAMAALRESGIHTSLWTGDAPQAAGHIARLCGIRDVRSNCLPENKLEAVRAHQAKGENICMIGDGINDAAALKAAHVGIAMGGIGSDIAIDAADMVLVGDEIKELPHLLRLARRTMRTIRVNLAASMLLNFIAIGLAMTGILNPTAGALAHNAGSVAVMLHSALLLKLR